MFVSYGRVIGYACFGEAVIPILLFDLLLDVLLGHAGKHRLVKLL